MEKFLFAGLDGLFSLAAVVYLFSAFDSAHRLKISPVYIAQFAAYTVCGLVVDNAAVTLILNVAIGTLTMIPYKRKWFSGILLSVMATAIFTMAEMLVGMGMMTVFDMSFDSTVNGSAYFIGLLLSRFIAYIVTFFIKVARHRIFEYKPDIRWLAILLLPIASMLVCCAVIRYIQQTDSSDMLGFAAIATLVVSNMLIFYFIDNLYDNVKNAEKLKFSQELIKNQEEQYHQLFANDEEIRRIRHDRKNFLIGIMMELEQGETEKLKQHIGYELARLDGSGKNTVATGNIGFDVFFNNKASLASQYGITLDLNVCRIGKISFSNVDMAVMLGNAVDNAIEAVKDQNGEKIIKISLCVNNGQMIFSVMNPVSKMVKDTKTTKKDERNHGFGITTIRQIAEKYGGRAVFISNEESFKTVIYLNLSELEKTE